MMNWGSPTVGAPTIYEAEFESAGKTSVPVRGIIAATR
jgi:hypothetical protein